MRNQESARLHQRNIKPYKEHNYEASSEGYWICIRPQISVVRLNLTVVYMVPFNRYASPIGGKWDFMPGLSSAWSGIHHDSLCTRHTNWATPFMRPAMHMMTLGICNESIHPLIRHYKSHWVIFIPDEMWYAPNGSHLLHSWLNPKYSSMMRFYIHLIRLDIPLMTDS